MKLTLQNSANGLIGVLLVAFGSLGISGGDLFPTATNVVGTYGGVLMPTCAACSSGKQVPVRCNKLDAFLNDNSGFGECPAETCAANSQGIFSITVPASGLSDGTFVMFSQGRVFSGTIQGTADAGKERMSGVLHATYEFTVTNPNVTPPTMTSITAEANGALNAKIANRSTKGIRLSGLASLDVSEGKVNPDFTPLVDCHMSLSVTGFKQ